MNGPDFTKMMPRRLDGVLNKDKEIKKQSNKTCLEEYEEFKEQFKDLKNIEKKKFLECRDHMKNIEPKRFKASSVMYKEKSPNKKDDDEYSNEPIWAHQYALGIGHS